MPSFEMTSKLSVAESSLGWGETNKSSSASWATNKLVNLG